MKLTFVLTLLFIATCTLTAVAQSSTPLPWEAATGYNYVHANAPPAQCGCFSLNGGTVSVLRQVNPSFGFAAEFNGVTNSSVDSAGHSLTLLTYLVCPRYRLQSRSRFSPFAQVLVGGAHASGGVYAPSGATTGSANAFATSMGGGADLTLTRASPYASSRPSTS